MQCKCAKITMQTCEEWNVFFARLETRKLYVDFQVLTIL